VAQVGRISGPLLTANLERQGKDIDFRNQQANTPLLKLKVGTNRIGVNTTSPAFELDVVDTLKGNFLSTSSLSPGNFTLSNNDINVLTGNINFKSDVRSSGIATQQLLFRDNTISSYVTNSDINFLPNGTGTIELQANTNVTGNLNASGNITFDGNLVFGDTGDDSTRLADTVTLNADIHSNIVPDANSSSNLGANYSKWNQLNFNTIEATNILGNSINLENGLIEITTRQGNIFYVDKNGNDSNVGDHPNGAFLTLKHALSFVDSSVQGPVAIHIGAGEYEEVFPLNVPANVTIIGEDMRNVIIKPTVATNTNNAFLLDGETTIENITIQDYFSPGYAFSFKSNATVTSRSPYIRNITVITKGSVTSVSDPRGYDQGDAGKGVLVDGASVTSSSQEASMLFHSVTFITPGVESVKLTNGVRVEWLNSFIYFAQQGILLERGSTGHLSTDGSTIQYGAEMRLIGSANVYGEFGIKADGAGTNAYLINHNFTYIGTGKSTANDDTLSIHENEVVEINSGRVNFTTVDEQGNYRVGSALFVNQDTGKTEIQSASIDFSNTDSLTIVTGGSTVTIDDSRVRTDFIRLRDNKLESLVGNLKVDSALNTVNINANTNITGNLDTAGNATISGSLVSLGDADTDNISFNSDVTSGMTPNVNSLFNLGSTTKSWRTAYAEKLTTDIFDIEGNRLTTKDSNEDLELVASGTGNVKFSSLTTGQAFTQTDVSTLDSGDATSDINVTDNITISKDSFFNNLVTPFLQVDGFANLGTTSFVGNRITTNESDANLVMAPAGTGKVKILSDVLVENTIIAPGANYSFASATMEKTSGDRLITNNISLEQMIAGDIVIEGNVITTNVSNSDLDFRASGAGKVILDENVEVEKSISVNTIGGVAPNINATDITADFATINTFFSAPSAIVGSISLAGNRIQTIDSNADLEFNANGTGNVILDELVTIPNLTIEGNTNLGISTAPSATFDNATVTNNIIAPSRITMEGIQIFGNKIQTKSSDSNLEFRANGTGVVRFMQNTNLSQNLTVNGTLTAHNIGIAGDVDLNELETDGNIEFNDNYVTTTVSNSNLELRTSGGAFIDLQGLKVRDDVVQSSSSADIILDPVTNLKIDSTDSIVLPKTLTDSTNTFSNNIGAIQYNADVNEIVGRTNTFKKVLGAGLYSDDLQTSVTPRPGNKIEFTAQSINSMTTSYGATTMNRLELTSGMDIDGNTIQPTDTNSDLILAPEAGQGKVQLENLHVLDNTFTAHTDNAYSISASGDGYIKFNQTSAWVIPTGTSANRPTTPEIGTSRWNAALGYLEVYSVGGWTDASGSGATVSAAEMDEIMNEFILIFG
jgi:hypothetical protein